MKAALAARVKSPKTGAAVPSREDLAPSFAEFELGEMLGRGGMGAVYRARHRKLDRDVALKVLLPGLADQREFSERFTREARALARLDHPNIVRVYDFGEREGLFYLVLEYVDGLSLRQLIDSGEMRSVDALRIIPQICDALQFAHDRRVVHRDIKPENILVDEDLRVRIADFGLAKLLASGPDALSLTATEQIMGTPHYMAPEQVRETADVDHRADIYSLGVVLYEMLTGRLPIGRFGPPSEKASVGRELDDVVMKSLESEPEHRYQSAREIKSDVESADRDNRSRSSSPAPSWKWSHDLGFVIALVTVGLASAMGWVFTEQIRGYGIVATAWTSELILLSASVPNWLPTCAGALLAALFVLRRQSGRSVRDWEMLGLAAYGLFHCMAAAARLGLGYDDGSVGAGLWFSVFAFGYLCWLTLPAALYRLFADDTVNRRRA